jgi:hypothetical protein
MPIRGGFSNHRFLLICNWLDCSVFRTRGIFAKLGIPDFEQVHVQVIGAEESYGQHAIPLDKCPREVSLRFLSKNMGYKYRWVSRTRS